MKWPPPEELDNDQREIFLRAPDEEIILIVGPPGSGKTLIAIHRAHKLAPKYKQINLLMYNKVLKKYTTDSIPDTNPPENINITNFDDWFKTWYPNTFNSRIPKIKTGSSNYGIYHWERMIENIHTLSQEDLARGHWGALIIDEGQDFSPMMWEFFKNFIDRFENDKPSLAVFADDNQALEKARNSSIDDIKINLNINTNEALFRLDKNYRNTREVALFSRYFKVRGSRSIQLPRSNGTKPYVFIKDDINAQIEHITNYADNNPDKEIGVIVFGRNKVALNYKREIEKNIDNDYIVQCYLSTEDECNNVDNLMFLPSTITIINAKSAKGTEFDDIFLVNLQGTWLVDDDYTNIYKELYTMTSRARESLFIMLNGQVDNELIKPDIISLLPGPHKNLCTYYPDDFESKLNQLNWKKTPYDSEAIQDLAAKIIENNQDVTSIASTLSLATSYRTKDAKHIMETRLKEVESSSELLEEVQSFIFELDEQKVKRKLGL